MSLRCPVKLCPRGVGPGKLMCAPHWAKVPRDLQNRVYATWRARVDDLANADKIQAHEEAKAAAIAAVERLENAPPRPPRTGGAA